MTETSAAERRELSGSLVDPAGFYYDRDSRWPASSIHGSQTGMGVLGALGRWGLMRVSCYGDRWDEPRVTRAASRGLRWMEVHWHADGMPLQCASTRAATVKPTDLTPDHHSAWLQSVGLVRQLLPAPQLDEHAPPLHYFAFTAWASGTTSTRSVSA